MSRSPKIKSVRWPNTDLVSREHILECYKLANDVVWWRACSVGTSGCVCVCMRPPYRGECSGTPHWPMGRDSPTGHCAFAYTGTMKDEQAVDMLAGAVDSMRDECGCSLSCYRITKITGNIK